MVSLNTAFDQRVAQGQVRVEETALPAYFGDWLKLRRKELDLTQAELAQRAGCSIPALRKIEAGVRRPSKQLAGLLARSLEIPPEDQTTFIRVARGELNVERMRSPGTLLRSDHLVDQKPLSSQFNLPYQPTPFIGREAELAVLRKLLADPQCRLLTLTGMGGIGKTRLAIELAYQQQALFPSGVYFVPLASIISEEFIVPAVADSLSLTFSGDLDPQEQLLSLMEVRAKQAMLLVLDNLEHLLVQSHSGGNTTNAIGLLIEMLQRAPNLKIIATARERIGIHGEWIFELSGLPSPAMDQLFELENYNAPALFIQRARQVKIDFEVQPDERLSLVRVCQMVEGTPLAIELAAAWVCMLSVNEIAEEIASNLDFLTTSMRDIPERHRSLRVVFDHSWRLLSEEERSVLSELAVFRGGFQRDAAEQVAGASLALLSALMSKSFLYRSAIDRYDLHEFIRQFALEKLKQSGRSEEVFYKHLAYLVALARTAHDELRGPQQSEWYNRLEQEYDNIRAALEWAYAPEATTELVELGLQLVIANVRFWQGRGHMREGVYWLERGLSVNKPIPLAVRARALSTAGWLVCYFNDCQRASTMLNESIALYSQLNDELGLARALDVMGDIAWLTGDFVAGKTYYGKSLALFRKLGNPVTIGLSLYSAGRLHVDNGYYQEADSLLREGLSMLQVVQDWRGIAMCKNGLGRIALLQGDLEKARKLIDEALRINYEIGHKFALTECFQELAIIALQMGHEPGAIRLWSVATALKENIGVNLLYTDPIYHDIPPSWYENIRSSIEWAEGQSMSLEQAIEFSSNSQFRTTTP